MQAEHGGFAELRKQRSVLWEIEAVGICRTEKRELHRKQLQNSKSEEIIRRTSSKSRRIQSSYTLASHLIYEQWEKRVLIELSESK